MVRGVRGSRGGHSDTRGRGDRGGRGGRANGSGRGGRGRGGHQEPVLAPAPLDERDVMAEVLGIRLAVGLGPRASRAIPNRGRGATNPPNNSNNRSQQGGSNRGRGNQPGRGRAQPTHTHPPPPLPPPPVPTRAAPKRAVPTRAAPTNTRAIPPQATARTVPPAAQTRAIPTRGFPTQNVSRGKRGRIPSGLGYSGVAQMHYRDPGTNPFLKPIKFIKSSVVLFQEEDDIFAAEVVDLEQKDPESVPTADRVEQLFHQAEIITETISESESESSEEEDEDGIESAEVLAEVGPETTRLHMELLDTLLLATEGLEIAPLPKSAPEDIPSETLFFVDDAGDTNPPDTTIHTASTSKIAAIGTVDIDMPEEEDDDDIVVYVPPGVQRVSERQDSPVVSFSLATNQSAMIITEDEVPAGSASTSSIDRKTARLPIDSVKFISLAKIQAKRLRARDPRKRGRRIVRKGRRMTRRKPDRAEHRGIGFHDETLAPGEGDSDLDWGSDGPPGAEHDSEHDEGVAEGMEVDPELSFADYDAFTNYFRKTLGSNHKTMDDVQDELRMAEEDAEDDEIDGEASSIGDEAHGDEIVEETAMMIEEGVHSDGSDDSDDEDGDGQAGFQLRLDRMRRKGKGKVIEHVGSDEGDDYELFSGGLATADSDEDYIAGIRDILSKHEDILIGRSNRKERKRLFKSIENGDFDHRRSNESKDFSGVPVSADVIAQWTKDREKKAKYKQDRARARLEAEILSFPRQGKGKGKNKQKNRSNQSNDVGKISLQPITNMFSLEKRIRIFLADLGGPKSMPLPPMDKESRRRAHLLCECFHLKSDSKGKGQNRFITISKKTRSGINIDEAKIQRLLDAEKVAGVAGANAIEMFQRAFNRRGKGVDDKGKKGIFRDGDVIGQHAAKIGEDNIGYKLLQSMGWSEGNRIGVSGGLHAPLAAVIKKTKSGLGAT